jgi:hypothetical protein
VSPRAQVRTPELLSRTLDGAGADRRQSVRLMLVRLGWPDCDRVNRQRRGAPQDAYWVECSADEGLPLLAARTDNPPVPLETLGWGRTTLYPIDHQRFYFLVSRDGSSIIPLSADYPTSSQWQGRSPFGPVGPFDISDLSELADLPAPPKRESPARESARRLGVHEAVNSITRALGLRRR